MRPFTLFILPLALVIGLACAGYSPGTAGPFKRAQMESLVAQVRLQEFIGKRLFFWKKTSRPPTLLTGSAGGQEIWAERTADRKLKVVILTEDDGYRGAYGFAFSETPLSPSPDATGAVHLDVPGPLTASSVKQQIDAHWRQVFDDDN